MALCEENQRIADAIQAHAENGTKLPLGELILVRRDGTRIPFEEARAADLEDLDAQMREEWQAAVRTYRMGFAYGPA